MAADRGHGDARYNLTILYERGRGVARDDRLAYQWFNLAAAAGDAEVGARRDAVAWRLTPGELGAAEAAAWRAAPAGDDSTTSPEAEMVAKVQGLLTTPGFDPGPADAAMRHRTAQAIRDYQDKLGLAVDGRVSEALLGHLEKVTGAGG